VDNTTGLPQIVAGSVRGGLRRATWVSPLVGGTGHTKEVGMRNIIRRIRSEDGMSTAEYAIGTVAACGLGGILVEIITSDAMQKTLTEMINKALGAA